MAVGGVTGLQAQRAHRQQHLRAVHCHQTVCGAHKVHAAPTVLQLVAHDLGNRQLGDRFVQRLLHAFGELRALGGAVVEKNVGLAVVLAHQTCHGRFVCAQCVQLLDQRGRGLAFGVQADGGGHELLRHGLVGGLRQHFGDVCGQAAWRGISRHARVGRGEALGLELIEHDARERVAQLLQDLGWQLFHKQFNKKILCSHLNFSLLFFAAPQAPFLFCCCCSALARSASTSSAQALGAIGKPRRARLSRYALATARARLRMRPI